MIDISVERTSCHGTEINQGFVLSFQVSNTNVAKVIEACATKFA